MTKLLISNLFLILMLMLLAPKSSQADSTFYLSVERTFSDTEKPVVRLDYSLTTHPILIRILRPDSVNGLLEDRLEISQTYKRASISPNPGYYFVLGINRLDSPLQSMSKLFSPSFLAQIKDADQTSLFSQDYPTNHQTNQILPLPEKVHIGPPPSFFIVREYSLDPKHTGEYLTEYGPWSDENTPGNQPYKVKKLELEPLSNGIYIVQALQGSLESQCLMQISSMSIQVEQSTNQLVVRVIDRKGRAVPNSNVSIRNRSGQWFPLPSPTSSYGDLRYDHASGALDGQLLVRVSDETHGDALVSTDFKPVSAENTLAYIFFDHSSIKPGESLNYKGIVRSWSDGSLLIPKAPLDKAGVNVILPENATEIYKATVPLSEFGTFNSKATLSPTAPPGQYELTAEVGGNKFGSLFKVESDKRPSFYLEMLQRGPVIFSGKSFPLRFRARRYSGSIPQSVKYEISLFRNVLDLPHPLNTPQPADSLRANEYCAQIPQATNPSSLKEIYSSIKERLKSADPSSAADSWDSAPLMSSSGEASTELLISDDGFGQNLGPHQYIVFVRAIDPTGSQATLTEAFCLEASEVQGQLSFVSPIAEGKSNLPEVLIRTFFAGGTVAADVRGIVDAEILHVDGYERTFSPIPFQTDQSGVAKVLIGSNLPTGKITATARLLSIGSRSLTVPTITEPAVMVIADKSGESAFETKEVELYPLRTNLGPGELTRMLVVFPSGWGENNWGTFWETTASSRIFGTRTWNIRGRSFWIDIEAKPEYGTGFLSTVIVPRASGHYKQATARFQIIPWQNRLHVSVEPQQKVIEPLKTLPISIKVQDFQGQLVSDAEVSISVVERISRGNQPSLQPNIFDFFYSLPTLNTQSFYSDSLHGFGKGGSLHNSHFPPSPQEGSTALLRHFPRPKLSSVFSHFSSSVALWVPQTTTSSSGEVKLNLELPNLETEWVITAIAVDKRGRLGEGNDHFRSSRIVSIEPVLPTFLRKGDALLASVNIKNGLPTDVNIETAISSSLPLIAPPLPSPTSAPQTLSGLSVYLGPQQSTETAAKDTLVRSEYAQTGPDKIAPGQEVQNFVMLSSNQELSDALIRVSAKVSGQDTGIGDSAPQPIELKPSTFGSLIHHTATGTEPLTALETLAPPTGAVTSIDFKVVPKLLTAVYNAIASLPGDEVDPSLITNELLGKESVYLWPNMPDIYCPSFLLASKALMVHDLSANELSTVRGIASSLHKLPSKLCAIKTRHTVWDEPWFRQVSFVHDLLTPGCHDLHDLLTAYELVNYYHVLPASQFSSMVEYSSAIFTLLSRAKEQLLSLDLKHQLSLLDNATLNEIEGGAFMNKDSLIILHLLSLLAESNLLTPELIEELTSFLYSQYRGQEAPPAIDTVQILYRLRNLIHDSAEKTLNPSGSRKVSLLDKNRVWIGDLSPGSEGFSGTFRQNLSLDNIRQLFVSGLTSQDMVQLSLRIQAPSLGVDASERGLKVSRSLYRLIGGKALLLKENEPLRPGEMIISKVTVEQTSGPWARNSKNKAIVIDPFPSLAEVQNDLQSNLLLSQEAGEFGVSQQNIDRVLSSSETKYVIKLPPHKRVEISQIWRVRFSGQAVLPPAYGHLGHDERINGHSAGSLIMALPHESKNLP